MFDCAAAKAPGVSTERVPMTIATESSSPRRLLLINPNTTSALTQTITRFVQAALPSDVVVESVTARFGAPYIATEVGYAVAAHAALDAWTDRKSVV